MPVVGAQPSDGPNSEHLMPISRVKAGFTLIELLMVMVIIGLLAAIAIPKFTDTKSRAYVAAQRSDLANLAMQQEVYFFTNHLYGATAGAVAATSSNGIMLSINEANGTGWSASTAHASTTVHCAVFYGTAAAVTPATVPGMIKCQ